MTRTDSLEDWLPRGGGLRFTQLLDALPEAITIRSTDDRIVFANRAALAQFEVESIEQLRDRTTESRLGDYSLYEEHGKPLKASDLPSATAVRDEAPEPLLVRAVDRRSGATRWWRMKSLPLLDVDGQLIGASTVIEDLTPVKTAEIRTRVLAESGRLLACSLDYEQTLHNVTEVAVPAVADWCAVELIDEQLRRERLVIAPSDTGASELADSLSWFRSEQVDLGHEFGQVLRTGDSILHERINDEQLTGWATDAAGLRKLIASDLCSLLIVPLRVPGRIIGVMVFITDESRLTPDDQALGEQLGRRAAVVVENCRLHARLSDVAETLERSLLPDRLPDVPGWTIASMFRPVDSELRIDVGGDFFELFGAAASHFAVIGDVEGKGVTAATLTTLMRHGTRFAARFEQQPAALLSHLDEALRHHTREATCTALCVRIEPDRLVLSSAGHPPALIARGRELREVPEPGPLLGAFEDASWSQQEVEIAPGEVVLLYTDGVSDTLGGRGRFGRDRLRSLMAEHAHEGPHLLLEALDRVLRADEQRRDDLAALAFARS